MTTLDDLRSQREALLEIARRHGVCKIRVFGSLVRGEATARSDVDLLVDMQPGRSLLDLIGFEQDAAELLGRPVDVVAEGGISPYLANRILAEAQPV